MPECENRIADILFQIYILPFIIVYSVISGIWWCVTGEWMKVKEES